jgi:hypothetical protein
VLADPAADHDKKRSAQDMIEFYSKWTTQDKEREMTDDWKKNNLEYDLRTTDWILAKARESESYAQNIYAALCNNDFVKLDVFQILREETWGCSWRHAGGIVADMRVQGDYIDWYCSGMRGDLVEDKVDSHNGFVPEGTVTDEIREDFIKLGWSVWRDNDE